jgi:hypothetical protein
VATTKRSSSTVSAPTPVEETSCVVVRPAATCTEVIVGADTGAGSRVAAASPTGTAARR